MKSLLAKASFGKIEIKTSARNPKGIYDASMLFKNNIRLDGREALKQKGRGWFSFKEEFYCALGLNRGEELFVQAVK